jgi:hypothetical protein
VHIWALDWLAGVPVGVLLCLVCMCVCLYACVVMDAYCLELDSSLEQYKDV